MRLAPAPLAALTACAALLACGGGGGGAAGQDQVPGLQPIPAYALPACAPDPWPLATTLLVGYAADPEFSPSGAFHLRYQYLAGALAPDGACLAAGRARAAGCEATGWWGTWQWDQLPPGAFVRDFVAAAEARHLVPMFTWYMLLTGSGVAEGRPEVTVAARDPAFLRRYLNDYRFFLVQLGCHRALVHLEPDFWGYAQQETVLHGGGPATLPAAVRDANPADCGTQPDTLAGLGRCMIAMARKWAPHAKVGLHGSAWGSNFDCVLNRNPSLDVAAKGASTGAFLDAAGAGSGDFVAVDLADRDAGWRQANGYGDHFLRTDSTLPSYAQAFRWSRALAGAAGRPLLWWQVPVGNMALPDQPNRWKDNKVEFFFDNPDLVVSSGAVGMAFGAGEGAQTTPLTDGWYLYGRAAALRAAGGRPLP